MNVKLSPDPMPEQGIFTRSDHYQFVRQGVPAVFLMTGYANGGEKAWSQFLADVYHSPRDDMSQKIDWKAGARFAEANYRITRAMADSQTPPLWYAGRLFRRCLRAAGCAARRAECPQRNRCCGMPTCQVYSYVTVRSTPKRSGFRLRRTRRNRAHHGYIRTRARYAAPPHTSGRQD